jgi:multiple sugar transport system permease protein
MKAIERKLPGYLRQDRIFGVFITLPAVVLLALLFVFPIIYSFFISFTNYNFGVSAAPQFIGVQNYIDSIKSPEFHNSLKVTFTIALGALAIEFLCGMVLAVLVNGITSGAGFFKAGYLIPMMVAPTVAGLLFRFILNGEFGILNTVLRNLKLIEANVQWLTNTRLSVFSIMIVDSWATIPMVFLLLYTALSALSHDMLEAGRIDGASAFQIFYLIQLPNIKGPALVTLFIRFMDVFRIYDSIYVLTKGGPGTATESLSILIYKVNWTRYDLGMAASMSYIMMAIMFVIALVIQYFNMDKEDRFFFKKKGVVNG